MSLIISTDLLDSVPFYYYLKNKINNFRKEFEKHHNYISNYQHNIYDFIDDLRKIKSDRKNKSSIIYLAIINFYPLYRPNNSISIDKVIINYLESYNNLF